MKEDLKARLAAALKAKEERDADAEEKALERQVEWLELEGKLVKELGPVGHSFDMLNTSVGPIAFRLGEAVLHKQFRNSKQTEVDIHNFVTPCIVHPARDRFLEIVGERPGVAVIIANKLADLYAGKAEDDAGKR